MKNRYENANASGNDFQHVVPRISEDHINNMSSDYYCKQSFNSWENFYILEPEFKTSKSVYDKIVGLRLVFIRICLFFFEPLFSITHHKHHVFS